jgi:peptidyl-prolyl cis-trans isomerase A (cyclophilin A)
MTLRTWNPTLMVCALLSACAFVDKTEKGDLDAMPWLDLGPGSVEICLSRFVEGPRLRDGKTILPQVRDLLVQQKAEEAMSLLAELDSHPQVEVHRATTELMLNRIEPAWQRVRGLLDEYSGDPCLLQLAGVIRLLQDEDESALGYATEAVELSGGHAELLFFQSVIYSKMNRIDDADDALRKTLEVDPAHEGAAALLGVHYLERGDGELAVRYLKTAFEGDMDVSSLLAPAYYDAGMLDDYIRVASGSGWPLGDSGRLAEAESPMDALAAHLGVGPLNRLFADFHTSMGTMRCELFWKQVPVTVANFVALSRGGQAWTHPVSGESSSKPLYTGTLLHRVIPKFMIQGGDPIGTGTGGPGYSFVDEIFPSHRFEEAGMLAMANSGPNTNGSQWFITEVPTPHLNGRHTIFGQCDSSALAVVQTITSVETDASARPFEDVTLEKIEITGE